jgi:copper chaperone CopZ
MMEFKALRVPTLNQDVAQTLETLLNHLPGVEHFVITLEHSELCVVFDENQLDLHTLVQVLAQAGCPVQRIEAALIHPVCSISRVKL